MIEKKSTKGTTMFCFSSKGRCTPRLFLVSYLFYVGIVTSMVIVTNIIMHNGEYSARLFYLTPIICFCVGLLPINPVTISRLHDTGLSGWWSLISFVPLVGSLTLFYLLMRSSEKKDNKWGKYVYSAN